MTITYPLSLPNEDIAQIQFIANNAVAISRSPYTGQAQTVQHDGAVWTASVSLPTMSKSEAADWQAFIAALNGPRGTFLLGDSSYPGSRGTPGGTPVVNGADQNDTTLVTDGWSTSTTVLKAGDFISIENRLHMVTADVTSDGSGNATIDIWPQAREPADNATITYTSPKGLFRLSGQAQVVIDADPNKYYSLSFAAEEAL